MLLLSVRLVDINFDNITSQTLIGVFLDSHIKIAIAIAWPLTHIFRSSFSLE